MLHLQSTGFHTPSTAPVPAQSMPYSDWQARAQRILDHIFGLKAWAPNVEDGTYWQSMFDCGISPHDAVDSYLEDL